MLERELTAPRVYSYNERRGQFMRTRIGIVRRSAAIARQRVCGVGVVGGAARCPSSRSEAVMFGSKHVGDRASVRSREFGSVGSSEVQMY